MGINLPLGNLKALSRHDWRVGIFKRFRKSQPGFEHIPKIYTKCLRLEVREVDDPSYTIPVILVGFEIFKPFSAEFDNAEIRIDPDN